MKGIITAIVIAVVLSASEAFGFFDPSGPYYGKVMILRANTYETYPTNVDVMSPGVSMVSQPFYDQGDTNADITANYGGNPTNTFYCAWPVSIYVYLQTNAEVLIGGEYEVAKLQYFEGSNSLTSVAGWTDIETITNFSGVLAVPGAHFGLVTWQPPKTNNVFYLIRIWARLKNGMQNASTNSLYIDKRGNNNVSDWNNYEVLLTKTCPTKKPQSSWAPSARSASSGQASTMSAKPPVEWIQPGDQYAMMVSNKIGVVKDTPKDEPARLMWFGREKKKHRILFWRW